MTIKKKTSNNSGTDSKDRRRSYLYIHLFSNNVEHKNLMVQNWLFWFNPLFILLFNKKCLSNTQDNFLSIKCLILVLTKWLILLFSCVLIVKFTDVDYAFGLNCVISMVIEIKTIVHAGFLSGGRGIFHSYLFRRQYHILTANKWSELN